jgi:myo-inositol 2-dehydrogenase/D-chiro-inositol 1-dehydrogenase
MKRVETGGHLKQIGQFMQRYIESYIAEMKEFVECVLHDKAPQVTGIDGRIPVVMGYAANRSFQEDRPVKLSEVDQ